MFGTTATEKPADPSKVQIPQSAPTATSPFNIQSDKKPDAFEEPAKKKPEEVDPLINQNIEGLTMKWRSQIKRNEEDFA